MTAAGLTRRFVILRGLRWMPLGVVLPYIILLLQARGLSLSAIGALWACHSAIALLCEVPSGALADAYGRRRSLVAGGALMTVSLVLYALAEGVAAFVPAVVALAAGRALISGSLEAWYVDALRAVDPEASLRPGLSRGAVADSLGIAAGALAGGFLPLAFTGLDRSGEGVIVYTPVTLAAAALAAGYLVAVLVLVDEAPRVQRDAAATVRARVGAIMREAAAAARSSRVIRTVFVVAGAVGVVMSTVELLWQPRLGALLGDAADHSVLFGVLVAGSMAAAAAGSALSPRFADGVGARVGYAAGIAGLAAAAAGLAAAGSPAVFVLVYLVFFGVIGLSEPVHFEYLHEATEDAVRATVMSAEGFASQAGGIPGNLGLSLLAAAAGIPWAWIVASVLVGLSCLLVLRLPSGVRVMPGTPAS